MKTILLTALVASCMLTVQAKKTVTPLSFDATKGVKASLTMPNGQKVNYTAY